MDIDDNNEIGLVINLTGTTENDSTANVLHCFKP